MYPGVDAGRRDLEDSPRATEAGIGGRSIEVAVGAFHEGPTGSSEGRKGIEAGEVPRPVDAEDRSVVSHQSTERSRSVEKAVARQKKARDRAVAVETRKEMKSRQDACRRDLEYRSLAAHPA